MKRSTLEIVVAYGKLKQKKQNNTNYSDEQYLNDVQLLYCDFKAQFEDDNFIIEQQQVKELKELLELLRIG